jgi:hypothetical protein
MPRLPKRLLLVLLLFAILLSLVLLSGLLGGSSGRGDRFEDPDRAREGTQKNRVRTASGAPPPPGTRVLLSGPGGTVEATVEASGEFRFESWPEDAETVEAISGPLRIRVPAKRSGLELSLPESFEVAGRVGDAVTGEPIESAEVECGGVTGRTGPAGRFRLPAVPATPAIPERVTVRHADYVDLHYRPPEGVAWDDLLLKMTPE